MSKLDFEVLRAQRNARMLKFQQTLADEESVPLSAMKSSFNPEACYCACGQGGPCEHRWDGEDWTSEDGLSSSVTCSRCGGTAMSHDLRYF